MWVECHSRKVRTGHKEGGTQRGPLTLEYLKGVRENGAPDNVSRSPCSHPVWLDYFASGGKNNETFVLGRARGSALGVLLSASCFLLPGARPLGRGHGGGGGERGETPGAFQTFWKDSYLVDPASSHMLVSKIKPCMSKYKHLYCETANGSINQL